MPSIRFIYVEMPDFTLRDAFFAEKTVLSVFMNGLSEEKRSLNRLKSA